MPSSTTAASATSGRPEIDAPDCYLGTIAPGHTATLDLTLTAGVEYPMGDLGGSVEIRADGLYYSRPLFTSSVS